MIQRYDVDYCTQHACTCEFVKDGEGGYVEYEDYAALEAKYSSLTYIDSEPFAYIIQDKYEREKGLDGHLSRSHVSKYVSQEDINEHEITCIPLYRQAQLATAIKPLAKTDDEDYAALEAKYSEAQRELVALRSQVRDASLLVKQLHDVVATIGVDVDAPKEEAWTVWFGGANPVPGGNG